MAVTFQEHRLGTLTSLGAQVTLPATYTINIWVKNVTLPGQEWSNLYLQNSGYKYILDANYGAIGAGTGPTRLAVSAADPLLVADTFHLVSCVFDGTTIEYYVNGVSIGSTTPAADAPTVIDVLNGPAGQTFAAEVKDMRVYSGVSTAGEILASYNAGDGILAPAPATVDVTFLMEDSYGDGWNGSTFVVYDANGATVESHTLAGGYSQTVQFDLDEEPHTWAFINQSWMSEITATLTRDDTSEQLLFSQAGSVLSGAFDLSSATPEISPTLSTSAGDITISASLNAEATAAGATGWAYALTDIFVEGQAHGGTAMAIGASATESPTPHGVHTIYVAAIDAAGLVVVANSASINNSPVLSITIVKADSYNDSWDGTNLVITNSSAVEVYNATLANGASPETILLDLPYDTYSWAMVGGSYHNEHTVTITLTSDGTQLAHSAAHSPSSGSFLIGPPAAAITATASVSGTDITVTGVANATAVSEGAANWSASLTEFGAVGATIDGAKALTALGVDAVLTVATGGAHTVYVAVVDAAGVILASSTTSVDVRITTWSVGDELVLWVMLDPTDADAIGDYTHPMQHPSFGSGKQFGPFYMGDLEIKTLGASTLPSSDLITPVTFSDDNGGTLDMKDVIKNIIKKYKLNEMAGIHATYGAAFQLAVDANTLGDVLLNSMDEVSMNVSRKLAGGGYTIDSYTKIVEESGALVLQESTDPVSTSTGDGGQFTGIYWVGEDPNTFYNSLDASYGLTAHYPFESDANTAVGGANGTLMGDASASGTALILDGSGDYVRIPHDASNDFGGVNDPFSVSMWFKSSTAGPLLYKGRQSSASDFWGIYLNADGTVSMSGWDQGPDQSYTYATQGNTYLDNEWHHFLVTHSDDGMIHTYIDGQMQFGGDGWIANHGNSDYLNVGGYFNYSWGSEYFTGEIKDVRLWNTDLIPLQALYLHADGLPASLGVSVSASSGDVTITTSVNSAALAAGTTHWAYSTSPLGAVGQPHGGTLLPVATLSDVFTPSVGYHTIYCAGVDVSGNVLFTETTTIDTTPIAYFKWKWFTTDWSGLNGGRMTLTDSLGTETLSPVVGYDTNGVWGESDIFTLPEGLYSWSVNQHSIRASDQGHLKLVEVDAGGTELREVVYVWAIQTRMFLDGTAWPNQVYAGQFAAPADSVDPVISLIGDATMEVYTGSQFSDPGYTVSDNVDSAASVVVSGHESLNVSDPWIQHGVDPMPTVDGETLAFNNPNWFDHAAMKTTHIGTDATDFEVVIDFENMADLGGGEWYWLNLMVQRSSGIGYTYVRLSNQGLGNIQAGWHDGDNYGPDNIAYPGFFSSGALKVARVGDRMKTYYSTDGEVFVEVSDEDVNASGRSFASGESLRVVLFVKRASVDITGFNRTDIPYGAQEGDYTITYTAEDFSGNTASVQRTVNVVPETSGVYSWDHNGNLSNIVKFCRGASASGAASYGYAKKEDDNSTTLYFATDMTSWATFGSYDASASGIEGYPVCMEYGPSSKVLVGTSTGKIYEVTLDEDSVPNLFVPLYTMPGGEQINTAKYGTTSGEWIFEAGGKMYTIPVNGSVATERYTLPAGARCVDIAEADDGIAMILRKADFSLEPRFALANWANIVSPAGMSNDMSALNATDLNYSYALDQWVASSADGNILTTADLITFLSA